MSAKTSPARRAAFMAAVAETGNRTLAAERAKVSASWVTLHRKTDPAFRAELDAALASARARLTAQRGGAAGMTPAAGWRALAGEELVVRGGNGRRTQIARARLRQWTPRIEARFLAALAGCCNVRAACAAVGLSVASAYNHRARWAAFAQGWDEALAVGYERIEGALLAAGCAMLELSRAGGGGPDADRGASAARELGEIAPELLISGMTVDAALQLLWLHRQQVRGAGGAPGARPRARDTNAVYARLERQLDRFDRQRARKAAGRADAAADRRGIAHGAAVVRGLGSGAARGDRPPEV
ncbi:hypothetical protein ACFOKI_08365 [Sphingomonas qilianensis]|uniref:Uncharacterized protein n=1 Tax=Sphingomonas qilianensis TaxID=1736690 RepID=A0ABU9XT08_9SPHN